MKKPLSEEFVKRSIIKWLSRNGWGHFEFEDSRTHGVDIKARKGGRILRRRRRRRKLSPR